MFIGTPCILILWRLKLGIMMLIHNKDDIDFFTEFIMFIWTACKIILWLLKLGITMLIHNKDDIEFVTEFIMFIWTACIYKINVRAF